MNTSTAQRLFFKYEDIARRWDVSRKTIERKSLRGELGAPYVFSDRTVRHHIKDIERCEQQKRELGLQRLERRQQKAEVKKLMETKSVRASEAKKSNHEK